MYLLDTHVFLWMISEPQKLSSEIIKLIQNRNNTLLISPVIIWEIFIKIQLGKLEFPEYEANFVSAKIKELHLQELPITIEHTFHLRKLPPIHRDPFDRLLICQAVTEKIILITNDQTIKEYKVSTIW